MADDEGWETSAWWPGGQVMPVPDVDWGPPETLIGVLWLTADSYVEVHEEPPPFGFGRYLN